MKWFALIAALLPVAEEIFKAIADTLAAGRTPDAIHTAVVDHVTALPAQIRAVA
jgi:hypothetical protein